MMHMTFYWGTQATILFDSWRTRTPFAYAISLAALFLFAVFQEFLVSRRLSFTSAVSTWSPAMLPEKSSLLGRSANVQRSSVRKILEAVLYGINVGIAYLLMLAVMSFNGGVFIAVVLGFSVGYMIFRNSSIESPAESQACGCP